MIKSYRESVGELLSSAEGQRKYLEWIRNDVTQLLLQAARELARPEPLFSPDASAALYQHGVSVGANTVIDFLASPESGLRTVASARPVLPEADYGSRGILKETA